MHELCKKNNDTGIFPSVFVNDFYSLWPSLRKRSTICAHCTLLNLRCYNYALALLTKQEHFTHVKINREIKTLGSESHGQVK